MPVVQQTKAKQDREDRESLALRENLKKRKKQQQARTALAEQSPRKQKED